MYMYMLLGCDFVATTPPGTSMHGTINNIIIVAIHLVNSTIIHAINFNVIATVCPSCDCPNDQSLPTTVSATIGSASTETTGTSAPISSRSINIAN